jgi:O-antigen ligase
MLAAMILMVPTLFRRETESKVRFLLGLLFGTSIFYAIGGLNGDWGEVDRAAAFGGGPNVFARIMGMGIIAALYFYLRTKRVVWLVPVPFSIGMAILSGSRSGILALALSLTFFLLIAVRSTGAVRRVIIGLGCVLMILLSLPAVRSSVLPYWQQRFVEESFEDRYDAGRFLLFTEAAGMFQENPVRGVGLDGFRRLSEIGEYTHNLFFQVSAEGGSVGLILLVIALVNAVRGWSRRGSLEEQVIFCLALLIFVAQMFSGSYYDARYMWIFFGILWVLRESNDRGPEQSRRLGISEAPSPLKREPQHGSFIPA